MGLEWSKTAKCFFENLGFFVAFQPPRSGPPEAAHRLRWLPVGGSPLGGFFFTKLIKIIDFKVEIIVFMVFFMSFPMKKSRVFLEKLIFIFKIKNFKGTPSHPRNQHSNFFRSWIFFGGVRNDPMCQKFFDPQTSTRVGDTVSLSYSVVKINNE